MATFFQHYFAGTDNLRIVSIILLLLAFILFLFLIVILYIKSLLSFIRESEASLTSQGTIVKRNIEDQELEKELEKELERDLENFKNARMHQKEQQKKESEAFLKAQKEIERQKEEEKKAKQKTQSLRKEKVIPLQPPTPISNFRGHASLQEFDWKTGKQGELDELAAGVAPLSNPTPTQKPIIDVLGLIINMLGRDIDIGKIAQTVKSKCGNSATEEEIIQTIDAIQSFISLANNGRFLNLPDKETLPTPEMALLALSRGNTAPTLSLMESLINTLVDKAAQTNMPQKRDIIFLEASNYACTFGSIANMEGDPALATSAFELALELSPKNPNAWSRVADCYAKSKTESKAVWAYQNVLTYGDSNQYPHQIANANKKLADYYEIQGDKMRASELYGRSNSYYNTIGINTRLTDKELNIIKIIESKQEENMPDTIGRLLNLSRKKQYI